jgi:hypothetical protein
MLAMLSKCGFQLCQELQRDVCEATNFAELRNALALFLNYLFAPRHMPARHIDWSLDHAAIYVNGGGQSGK